MKKYFFLILSLGLVLGVNLYLRAFPAFLPPLEIQAQDNVEQRIRAKISQDIDQKFPEYNPLVKRRLITKSLANYKNKSAPQIKSQIQQEYFKLKDKYQDPRGQTYLLEFDCWHWARYTDNVLRLGHPGDKVVGGRQLDTLMLAPEGAYLPWNQFLFYFSAWLYKIYSFVHHLPLLTFLFWLPLFFVAIFLILLYLFCFERWGVLGALVTCFIVGLLPQFLFRSRAGWFDTDVLNLIFPFIISWIYIKAYQTPSLKSGTVWLCFSAFWLGLFSFTWGYWWFIFFVILAYEIYSLARLTFSYYGGQEKTQVLLKKHVFSFIIFFGFALFWIILFSGYEPLRILCSQIKGALVLSDPLTSSVWPNAYSTVEELTKMDVIRIVHYISPLLFALGIACIVTLFLRTFRDTEYTAFEGQYITLLVFWLIIMFFACLKGTRFVMFIGIPLAIPIGWVIAEAYEYLKERKRVISVALLIAAGLLIGYNFNRAYEAAQNCYPMINDTWYKTLIKLSRNTPDDAIINSWWDFGDWFKAISWRRVIFDGQSQNTPQAYWMASALLTANEEKAINILRMLNNSGNQAFEILNQKLNDPFASILLLRRIIGLGEQEARKILSEFLPSLTTDKVMSLIFGRPTKAYFVVDSSLIDKISAISFLGTWDPIKLYIMHNLNKKGKKEISDYLVNLGCEKEELERFYQEATLMPSAYSPRWISQSLRFHSRLLKGKAKDGVILFDEGIVYDPARKKAYLYSMAKGAYKIPKSLFFFNQDALEEIVYPDSDLDYSVLIFQEDGYRAILLDRELAKSIFVRLYFLGARGLRQFKPFLEEKEKDEHISVFEIIWG